MMEKRQSAAPQPSSRAASAQPVKIRPFPYPYKAGLAICNDLDGIISFEELKAIHDVLNGRGVTPCGPGLGLEVGDSLHFYSVHPEQDDTLSYFERTSNRRSAYAEALREGMAAGLLDTLHAWGNFSQKGGFTRKHAERALEELGRYNLCLHVWTNHGDIHNFQNLGRSDSLGDLPTVSSARGDRSRVLEYHSDLARQAGIRYVWVKELTEVAGQERPLDPADWLGSGVALGRDMLKGFLIPSGGSGSSQPLQLTNSLLKPVILRDGSTVYELLRYGSFDKGGSDYLPELLSPKILRRLVEVGGAMLLYTHLGKGRSSPEKPFSAEAYQALSRLAYRARDGDIWVTTPSRLCNYVELRQRLKLQVVNSQGSAVITGRFTELSDLQDPDISGLTLYWPQAQSCKLHIDDRRIQLTQNPPDHTGKVSFAVPLQPLEYCWE